MNSVLYSYVLCYLCLFKVQVEGELNIFQEQSSVTVFTELEDDIEDLCHDTFYSMYAWIIKQYVIMPIVSYGYSWIFIRCLCVATRC